MAKKFEKSGNKIDSLGQMKVEKSFRDSTNDIWINIQNSKIKNIWINSHNIDIDICL